jgi:small subunit ribosomal protein S20
MPAGTPVKPKKKKKSVLKNIRKTARRTRINRANLRRVRTAIKRVRLALAQGNLAQARQLLPAAYSAIDRGIQKGVLHENTANRYKSRLAAAVLSLEKRPAHQPI